MWTLSGFADEIDPDPHQQFRTLGDLGIAHVELRGAWGANVLDLTDAQLDELIRLLRQYGIAVSSVGSPIGKVSITDDFDEHLRRFDRALTVADRLESPYIRLFSFYIPEGDDPAKHRDEVMRRLGALAERARGHDAVLAHENERGIYGDVPSRCLDIAESVGSEKLRQIWDPANYVLCDVRPFSQGFAELRPHIAYLHIKDAVAATGQVVPAGQGDGQIREAIRVLRDDGFDGFFSMEPHLAHAGQSGGFSGADLFGQATRAFTELLTSEGVTYR